jgi:hypothetical protein
MKLTSCRLWTSPTLIGASHDDAITICPVQMILAQPVLARHMSEHRKNAIELCENHIRTMEFAFHCALARCPASTASVGAAPLRRGTGYACST